MKNVERFAMQSHSGWIGCRWIVRTSSGDRLLGRLLKRMVLLVLGAAIVLLTSGQAFAASHFVRSGATGAANGNNWTDAWTSLPGSLIRGDTYYVADGNYPSYTFDDANSAATYITVKKATATDHGIDTGWQDSYGDGQAVFGGNNRISTGYYDINGQNEYGFKFDFNEGQDGVNIGGASVTGVKLQFIDFDGISTTGNYNYSASTKGITIGRVVTDLLISHCALHGAETCINEGDGTITNGFDSSGTIVEYCHFYNSRSTSSAYHNNIHFCSGSQNGTWRYNRVHDYNDEGLFFTGWEGAPQGWKVYGNVFWSDGGEQNPRGIEIRQSYSYSGILIYNNTFVNLGVGAILNRTAETGNKTTACEARNNIGSGASFSLGDFSIADNNSSVSASAFVNAAGKDFHLVAPIAGVSLDVAYNTDMDGRVRGSDGVWDRGGYEYGGAVTPNPIISITPGSLDFGAIAMGATKDLTITVKNAGSGTLSGTASTAVPYSVTANGTYSLGANQTQAVTIRYAPQTAGTSNGSVSFTGGGGMTATLTGTASSDASSLSFESTSGTIAAPFVVSGTYISQGTETAVADGGRASYTFTVLQDGDYVVQALVNAPNTGADSFFVNVDAEPVDPNMIWDVPLTSGFDLRFVGWRGTGTFDKSEFPRMTFHLTQGSHQLIVRGREPNVQLGRLTVLKIPAAPQGLRIKP